MGSTILLKETDAESETLRVEVVEKILDAIQSVRFGSVEIVVHNSQVVQIERNEKIRFDLPVRI